MRLRVFWVVLGLACAAIGVGQLARAQGAAGPSFDCSNATTEVEAAICRDPGLAAADGLMARLYTEAQTSAFGEGRSNVLAAQRKWLADRDCNALPRNEGVECLRHDYDTRNGELAVAALFAAPELAMKTLRALDPDSAPLIEAIRLYASEPVGTDWASPEMAMKRQDMLRLLEPYARRFAQDDRASFGRDILADLGISSAGDALKREESFASFVEVASAYIDEGRIPPIMPCAAIVRHPELLEATGPVFGSTLDNFVLFPDCQETLPAVPALDRLSDQIWMNWPECEGTIRYAAYRSYGRALNAARLATERQLAGLSGSERVPRRKGVATASVNAAIAGLAAYYVRYDRSSADNAPTLARVMVREMMKAAHVCY